jgi:hypothetical protein
MAQTLYACGICGEGAFYIRHLDKNQGATIFFSQDGHQEMLIHGQE